jgi:hypothetical protein
MTARDFVKNTFSQTELMREIKVHTRAGSVVAEAAIRGFID